jgi:putative spermidine/putrescine transport system substrate-binding protein
MHAQRRHWKKMVSFGFVAAMAVMQNPGNAADLNIGAFGGVWEQSLRKCMIEPWQKLTGKTADVVLGSPIQMLNQVAASPGKPPVDILYNPTETSYEAIKRGLVDKFTPDKVPNMTEVAPEFAKIADDFGSVHNYGAMGLIYNSKTIPNPPKTWKEFVEGVAGGKYKASMPSVNYPSGGLTISVWWFAKLYGGDVDNIQPGLDQVKRMRDSGNMQFWSDPNQVLNGLKSGDIDIALYWDGRAWSFIDDGNADFKYYTPEPGAVVAMTWIQKMKGSPDLGYSFANFALSKEAQSCFGSAIRYGIANQNATFDPKIANEITPRSAIVFPPYKEVSVLTNKWVEAWNKQIGR